ncbi:MAG: sucrose-6-phosphate hydrolase [Bifidobacteriaceae bacterium]|nr:sucrose-6-phosphate hydrolase [Bifidobacteriaceae bacterium]
MAELNNPNLSFTDHEQALAQAEKSIRDLAYKRNNRWYPLFHIASKGGWINDPNGLCQYNGTWHVFYQLHPYSVQWGPMHWGHVSSKDLIHWNREAVALAPSLEGERNGVFSGSAVVGDDKQLYFYYTGHVMINNLNGDDGIREVQMLAQAGDSNVHHLEKLGMILDSPDDLISNDIRDPKVWKHDNTWLMIIGAQSAQHRGQILLFSSQNMREWKFEYVLFEHPDPNVFMLECPDFFPLKDSQGEEHWVICFSAMGSKPQGFMNRNVNNAGYMIGSWEYGQRFEPHTEFRLLDCGHNYYAPQTFLSEDNRRMMYGWMSPFIQPIPSDQDGWSGCLTLPREVYIGEDADIHTVPARELVNLRSSTQELGTVALPINSSQELFEDAVAAELHVRFNIAQSTAERIGLKLQLSDDGSYTYVAYDAQMQRIVIDKRDAVQGDKGYRSAPLSDDEIKSGFIDLQIFIDRGSIEVYVNNGRQVLSSFTYPGEGKRHIVAVAESGTAVLENITLHTLNSIGLA